MTQITTDVNWEIMPARETFENPAVKSFDQATQGDQPIGPEPECPSGPAPEVDGKM